VNKTSSITEKILINIAIYPFDIKWGSGAALVPKMLEPEKSPGIKFCRQFQKVGAVTSNSIMISKLAS
jgi:hypothetical protein